MWEYILFNFLFWQIKLFKLFYYIFFFKLKLLNNK